MIDPGTQAAWLVMGQVELGPQRRCRKCGQWWPLVAANWPKRERRYWRQPCKSCYNVMVRDAVRRLRARKRDEARQRWPADYA